MAPVVKLRRSTLEHCSATSYFSRVALTMTMIIDFWLNDANVDKKEFVEMKKKMTIIILNAKLSEREVWCNDGDDCRWRWKRVKHLPWSTHIRSGMLSITLKPLQTLPYLTLTSSISWHDRRSLRVHNSLMLPTVIYHFSWRFFHISLDPTVNRYVPFPSSLPVPRL